MRVAMLLYDGVEPIELAAFGVFSMARRLAPEISMYTVAENAGLVVLANELKVWADHGFADAPPAQVLVVPGGASWERQCRSERTLKFIRSFERNGAVASACTGGMILAASGLLDGRAATTRRSATLPGEESPLALLRKRHPAVRAVEARVVDAGNVLTAGGVTLCIDMALYLIERFLGAKTARDVAQSIEYSAALEANRQRLQTIAEPA